MHIHKVDIPPKRFKYLRVRKLDVQYTKQISYIIDGKYTTVDLKPLQPKHKGIWSFRINKQFRALCEIENEQLMVFKIDNHQN